MADSRRSGSTRRTQYRNSRNIRGSRDIYVEGSAARRLQEIPTYRPKEADRNRRVRKAAPKVEPEGQRLARERAQAAQRQKNRARANSMNRACLALIVIAAVFILGSSIYYLRLRSQIVASMKTVAAMESELSDLKEDNDSYYSQVTSNVDLSEIKKIAIGQLGMKYPGDDQILTYETEGKSYVRQYQDVPAAK